MNLEPSPDFAAEARSLGYFPFIRFSPLEYFTFKELYGEGIFDLFKRLKDPGAFTLSGPSYLRELQFSSPVMRS